MVKVITLGGSPSRWLTLLKHDHIMTHTSPDDVVSYVRDYEATRRETLDCDVKKVTAAIYILGRFCGGDWPESRLLPQTGRGSGFIHPPVVEPHDQFKRQARIIDLAEHLVNLQEVEGFEWCLGEICSDSTETGLAKLIVAGLLHRRNIPFRFVVPSRQQGKDYDAEAIIGAAAVPVEMKAKIEGKDPTPEGIANSLKVARRQLPRDAPNLVFLRVPEAWGRTKEGLDAIADGVTKEFRNSGTINTVVVHWEIWSPVPGPRDGAVRRGERLLIIGSGRARVELDALDTALMHVVNEEDIPWLSLHALLCS